MTHLQKTINSKFPFPIVIDAIREERNERYLDEHQDIYEHIYTRNKPNLKKIERFYQRWKQYPEVWNLLYGALVKNNRKDEAEKFIHRMLEVFPDYFFARANYTKRLIYEGCFDEAIDFLGGDTPDILRWYPDSKVFWIEHVLQHYSLYVALEIERDDFDKASDYISYVEDCFYLSADDSYEMNENADEISDYVHDAFGDYTMQIMQHRLLYMSEKWENNPNKKPEYVPPVIPEDYKKKYGNTSFTHPEIEALFELELLDNDTINSILSLPRQTAIDDLERILYHTMFEFTDEDFNKNLYYAVPHALWFLYEFKAVESIESACLLLQMDSEFTDYWFGDVWIENSWYYYFILLKHNHAKLLEVLYLPNKDAYIKSTLLNAAEQLAYHYPERIDEVIGWLSELLQFYIDNQNNEDILDSMFTGFIESTLIDLNAKELAPKLKILHENKCVDEMIFGDFIDVEEYFENPKPVGKNRKQLKSIFELAEEEKKWWDESRKEDDDEKIASPLPPFPSPAEVNEKKYPGTGRNEPCPCGSGKKYKKCCGR